MNDKATRALAGTRYIRDLIAAAEDVVEDIDALCGQMHGKREPCSFCAASRKISRTIKRARRQVERIEIERVRKATKR